ncbi:MAG: type II secretion system protein GspG [Pseudomonadota bacterium]
MKNVALLLVGVLAGVFFTVVASTQALYDIQEGCQKCKVAQIHMGNIVTALTYYEEDTGRFPSEAEGLQALEGDYLKQLGADPWNNNYQYAPFSFYGRPCFIVWSLGSDGEVGGIGNGAADLFTSCLTSQGSKGASRRDGQTAKRFAAPA